MRLLKLTVFKSKPTINFAAITLVLLSIRLGAQSNTATIYLDSTKQIIQGFGAANIIGWRPDMTDSEIEKAFGTGDGKLGFSILRLRIPYNSNDFNLQVPTAKKAYEMGVKIFASPWTPPPAMKTNNNIVGGELRESSYQAYADHLKSFVDFMAANGVPLYAVSVQNEPDITVTYESCDWNPAQMVKFIAENAPSIGTKIIAPESFQFLRPISDAILNDSAACANVDIIGGHIYGGGLSPYPLAESKGKEIWMTEHLVLETDWLNNLATGEEILDCMNAGMSAYIWWYIVRFYGPIYDDGSDPRTPPGAVKGEISKRGFVMSQFSRFIRPGYFRVAAPATTQRNIYLSAFRGENQVVIVAINSSLSAIEQSFKFENGTVLKFDQYVTTQDKNCSKGDEIAVSNGTFTASLEPSSITTFVSDQIVVPVELISFTASADEDKIQLSWSTATEKNNRGFEIQRKTSNSSFVTIGFVEGKGTTTEKHQYFFIDRISGEKFYYRLKQIDFDGTINYSNTIEVSSIPSKIMLFQNFPNPFNPATNINFSLPKSSFVTLKIFDVKGNEIQTLVEGNINAGYHSVKFDGSNFASGVYFYQLKTDDLILTKKLFLIK